MATKTEIRALDREALVELMPQFFEVSEEDLEGMTLTDMREALADIADEVVLEGASDEQATHEEEAESESLQRPNLKTDLYSGVPRA